MGLLTTTAHFARTAMLLLCILVLCLSGCTFTFSPTHVTTIPLVVLDEVPVPDSIKKAEPSAEPLQDISQFLVCRPGGLELRCRNGFYDGPIGSSQKKRLL